MKKTILTMVALALATPAVAKDIFEMRDEAPAATWKSGNPDLEYCVTLTFAKVIGGAPIVARRSADTLIAAQRGGGAANKLLAMVVIRSDGLVEYRGMKGLIEDVKQCL